VRYRPKKYWKPGTKVTVTANLNSVNAGNGVYGQNSTKTNFTVGRSLGHQDQFVLRRCEGVPQRQARPYDLCQRWQAWLADPQWRQADHGQALRHPE
jgi:hypothetical protein